MVDLVFLIHLKSVKYTMCETISAPLVRLILDQSEEYTLEVKARQTRLRKNVRKTLRQNEVNTAIDLKENLPIRLQRSLTVCSEKGASGWLSALPISEHGFALHKQW